MVGWTARAQLQLQSLRNTPPQSYTAAQTFYESLRETGRHVDVSEHYRILNALMGPLKEKADRDAEAKGSPREQEQAGVGRCEQERARSRRGQPSRPGSSRAHGLDIHPSSPAAGRGTIAALAAEEAESTAAFEERCAALPQMVYPADVACVVSIVREALSAVAGVEVRAYGSAVNGFGDETSDVDLVVAATAASLVKGLELEGGVASRGLASCALGELQSRLRKCGFHAPECRLDARIPVLKMRADRWLSSRPGGVECDLTINNLLPVFNTALLKAYADIDARAAEITQSCRRWAKAHGVHGARLGHLSSYAFALMVICYMQVKGALPCLQRNAQAEPRIFKEGGKAYNVAMEDRAGAAWEPAKEATIDFSGFVGFFCREFKWGEWVVSVRTGQCLGAADCPRLQVNHKKGMTLREFGELIHIEDPFDVERDLNFVLDTTHNSKLRSALEQQHALDAQSDEA
mmetsp:Transcript_81810/g.258003  ORF Transcript_81810/g.258003 Transcript_81810/m.258003 type:complete len:463 (+) Transcript_81810:72-1460(+)